LKWRPSGVRHADVPVIIKYRRCIVLNNTHIGRRDALTMANLSNAPVGSPADANQPARVFVGLKIATEIAGELAQLVRGLEPFSVRLIAPADIHLTLMPPWDETSIAEAIDRLRLVAKGFGPFVLTFQHVGYGPQPKRPRLLWAECVASDEMMALHAALLQA
jgi:hypothetical protein